MAEGLGENFLLLLNSAVLITFNLGAFGGRASTLCCSCSIEIDGFWCDETSVNGYKGEMHTLITM